MPFAFGPAALRAGMSMVVVGLLGSLLATPVEARHQDQAELSEVQDKLDATAQVLADTRADADQVARALVQADVTSLPPGQRWPRPSDATGRPGTGGPRRCERRCWPNWRSTPSRH